MKPITYGLMVIFAGLNALSCGREKSSSADKAPTAYYCPMHPEVTSDKPSVCPICFMDLVHSGGDPSEDLEQMMSQLTLDPSAQIVARVKTMSVRREVRDHRLQAYGNLEYAESNRKIIAARFSGRVERLRVNATGYQLKTGDILMEVYSPDVLQTENEYLLYYRKSLVDTSNQTVQDVLNNLRRRLTFMGITAEDLRDLEEKNEPHWYLPVRSSFSGWVIRKNLSEGSYFREGEILYEIDQLDPLWFIAEFYEADIRFLRKDLPATIRIYAFPGDTFSSRVDYLYPTLDAASRTLKVRFLVPNPHVRLRPQMNGEVYVLLPSESGIYIPKTAVRMTGKSNRVWVRTGEKTFKPVEVQVGRASGDHYEIISGLSEGMEIAVSGAYLIESESQLRGIP